MAGLFEDRTRGLAWLVSLLTEAREEPVHHEFRDTPQQSLSNPGDGATHLGVSNNVDEGPTLLVGQHDLGLSPGKPGPAGAVDDQPVARWRLLPLIRSG